VVTNVSEEHIASIFRAEGLTVSQLRKPSTIGLLTGGLFLYFSSVFIDNEICVRNIRVLCYK
jgi:hypothetical protein